MSNDHLVHRRSFLPRAIRRFSVVIILFWLAVAVITQIMVPKLEDVASTHNVALRPADAPSLQAMRRMGKVFQEFDSDSLAMIVLEGDKPLGRDAHVFYDNLLHKLAKDSQHVEHIQDFWGDTLTAAGVQSSDAKAAYVQVYLAGNQGQALANESVDSVRDIVAHMVAPAGVKAYVTGPAPLITDNFEVGSEGTAKVTVITVLVITVMLLFVYRSVIITILALLTVLTELAAARGIVAFLGNSGIIGLSTYATNLLTLMVIATGTDYVIFFLGRYQEGRQAGQDPESAFYSMFRETFHVILGSGLTIAGAVSCLAFTRLPYYQSLGIPAAIAVLVALAGALSLAPAVLALGSRFGLFDPRRTMRAREWRRIGTAIARWPGPILVAACAAAFIGLLSLPGYKTSYDARPYLPATAPANIGYAAAERHFSRARMNPELLMVETDHDMRNPADMLILERVAKNVAHLAGIEKVQAITRPLGTPIDHSSVPFQMSAESANQIENLTYEKDRATDLLKQAGELRKSISILQQQYSLQQQVAAATHGETQSFRDALATINEVRDKIGNFDDFFRPIRSYFYFEKHCYDIPICFAMRSIFEALDGLDQLSDQFQKLTASSDKLDAVQPQLVALIPQQLTSQEKELELTLSNYATSFGINAQQRAASENATALGRAFDTAKSDDFFYLPPEAFDNPDFKRGLKLFLSPDGKAARMTITHEGDPATLEGISHVDPIRSAARGAVKNTILEGARLYVAGTAATYKDIHDMARYDLTIVGISALSLIFLIMMWMTRSLVAAIVIVGTVALSLGTSFGLSVLIWQDIFGIKLHWFVLSVAVILLLAVGSDYNLLLVSRFKEEIDAGLNTGIIRAMAGSGSVVTAAGLVFAATMSAFIFSDLRVLGQIGTTVGIGLLFDTLIVRSFMTPSIAVLLGRWFWWPQLVRPRTHQLVVAAPRGASRDPAILLTDPGK